MNFGRRPSRSRRSSVSSSSSIAHAVGVHLDLHDVGLVGAERRHRARVGRRLGDDHVARVDQRLADEVDHLLAAGRDEHARPGRPPCPRPPSPRRCSRSASPKPSVGPYCSALRARLAPRRAPSASRTCSGGKVDVSGSPPASEITSARSVSAIRSRIAEDFMTLRARGEQARVALEVVRRRARRLAARHRGGSRCSPLRADFAAAARKPVALVYRHAAEATAAA